MQAFWPESHYTGKPAWFVSHNAYQQLESQVAASGVVSPGIGVWYLEMVNGRPQRFMRGFPLYVCPQSSTLGSLGDVALLDMSQYLINYVPASPSIAQTVEGLPPFEVTTSVHPHWDTNQVDYRFKARVSGQPLWQAPDVIKRTGVQVSPFVILK